MEQSFYPLAMMARVGLLTHQSVIASYVLAAAKLHAKALKRKVEDVTHVQALEALARVSGFPHWHAMQSLCERTASDVEATRSVPWQLSNSLRLMIQLDPDVAPDEEQKRALEQLSADLSSVLGADISVVREAVALGYQAASWGDLLTRDPVKSGAPMYFLRTFSDEPGGAVFTASPAAEALESKIEEHLERNNEELKPSMRKEVEDAVAARPDFLYGHMILGWDRFERGEPSRSMFSEGVRGAFDMLAARNITRVSWGSIGNRFFHRMLFGLMEASRAEYPPDALALADWMLALNPDDNQGVRLLYSEIAEERAKWSGEGCTSLGNYSAVPWTHMQRAHVIANLLTPEAGGCRKFATEHMKVLCEQLPTLREDVLKDAEDVLEFGDGLRPQSPAEAIASVLYNHPDLLPSFKKFIRGV